jgi:N-acetylglutamate synthase-like GNAT family acetyltransferase
MVRPREYAYTFVRDGCSIKILIVNLRQMRELYATNFEDIMTLQIRPTIRGDHVAILETVRGLPQWFNELGLRQIESDLKIQEGLVALENDHIAGFVSYAITEDEKIAELTWIAVRPESHRKGIGRCLVQSLEGLVMQLGVSAIEVSTVADSVAYEPYARTRDFYHALGFAYVRVDKKWFPSGDDRLLLRKLLTNATAMRSKTSSLGKV